MVEDAAVVQPLRPMVRVATERDLETTATMKRKSALFSSVRKRSPPTVWT